MIKTYDLIVYFHGYERHYTNISRTAVKYFIEYHKENPDFHFAFCS
jgi:hypothetical protein